MNVINLWSQAQINKSKFEKVKYISSIDGLSCVKVTCMDQDRNGYIWIGTEEGLNRYDGENILTVHTDNSRRQILLDHICLIKYLDSNRIIISTPKNTFIFNPCTFEFKKLEMFSKDADSYIRNCDIDADSLIYLSAVNSLYVLDWNLNIKKIFTPKFNNRNLNITQIHALDYRHLIVCNQYRLYYILDLYTSQLDSLSNYIPDVTDINRSGFINYDRSLNQLMVLKTKDNVQRISIINLDNCLTEKTEILAKEQKEQSLFVNFFSINKQWIYLSRYFGFPVIYNIDNGEYFEVEQWPNSSPDGYFSKIYIDGQGNLWVSPRNAGLFFVNLQESAVSDLKALNQAHLHSLKKLELPPIIYGFNGFSYKDKFIIGSGNGGLYSFNKNDQELAKGIRSYAFTKESYLYFAARIDGPFFLHYTVFGYYIFDADNTKSYPVNEYIKDFNLVDCYNMTMDCNGILWISSSLGMHYIKDRKLYECSTLNQANLNIWTAVFANDSLLYIFPKKIERVIYCYNVNSDDVTKLQVTRTGSDILTYPRHAIKVGDHELWINFVEGLYRLDISNNRMVQFGKQQGLSTNAPNAITAGFNNDVWISTHNGLFQYYPQQDKLRTFTTAEDLNSNFVHNALLFDSNHASIFVSTDKGFCLVDPHVEISNQKNDVLVEYVKSDQKIIYYPGKRIAAFEHDDNDIHFRFANINFVDAKNNLYEYYLEGAEDKWNIPNLENEANYINLRPGNYTFHVRKFIKNSIANNSVESQVSIIIKAPIWEAWWFRLIVLLGLGYVVYYFINGRFEKIKVREKNIATIRQMRQELEMKALRSQMNPHFIFNSLNSIQNYVLKNDTREASRYLSKFAKLMRLILENSESSMVPLNKEIMLLEHYMELEAVRFDNKFDYSIHSNLLVSADRISIPSMLIQPHIENAIWHGLMHKSGQGKINISIDPISSNVIQCTIIDNGIGRTAAALISTPSHKDHESKGLVNINKRLEILNTQFSDKISYQIVDLYNEQKEPTGTKIILNIPFINNFS